MIRFSWSVCIGVTGYRVLASRLTPPLLAGSWGTRENGTWTGLLGEVYRGNSSIAINYYTVTEDRGEDFDYSGSYYNEG